MAHKKYKVELPEKENFDFDMDYFHAMDVIGNLFSRKIKEIYIEPINENSKVGEQSFFDNSTYYRTFAYDINDTAVILNVTSHYKGVLTLVGSEEGIEALAKDMGDKTKFRLEETSDRFW